MCMHKVMCESNEWKNKEKLYGKSYAKINKIYTWTINIYILKWYIMI